MTRGLEPERGQHADQMLPAPPCEQDGQQEVDLDRLVWDPEYRRAVRPLIKPGS